MHLSRSDTTADDIRLVVSRMASGLHRNELFELNLAFFDSKLVCHSTGDYNGPLQGSHVPSKVQGSRILA